MTDSDVLNALERCRTGDCWVCPLVHDDECRDSLYKGALDLIKRLQAENEKLLALNKEALLGLHGICKHCKNDGVCLDRRGSHRYCWKWKHADFSVEMGDDA